MSSSSSTTSAAQGYNTYDDCTSVSAACPVEGTIYGYAPNLGSNIFFCAWFFIFALIHLWQGWRSRTWTFTTLIVMGALAEMIGYIGRIMLYANPWSNIGFEIQISCLIFAPSFFAAAIYLTLKDMVRAIGPQFSPIKAILYPWIFITCDILSLLLQAIGGGIAAGANDYSGSAMGGHIMLAGIVFQVATFTFLFILVGLFALRTKRNMNSLTTSGSACLHSREFKIFGYMILAASILIYARCVYRIAELAQGWANDIQRDEISYIIMDGVMCALAVLLLAFCHSGKIFVQKAGQTGVVDEEKQAGLQADSSESS